MSSTQLPPLSVTAQQFLEQRRLRIEQAQQQAAQTTPDAFAEARKIGRQLGEQPYDIVGEVEAARHRLFNQEVDSEGFRRDFPMLARSLEEMDFVSLTRDDLGNLQLTEGAWDWVARSWGQARNSSRRGTIGLQAMLERRGLTADERFELVNFAANSRAHAERDDAGFTGAAIEILGSVVDSLGAAVAVGAVSGPAAPVTAPAAAFAQSFRLEAGNLYADLIEDGYTPAQAMEIATTYGTAISAVEFVGLRSASAPFREFAQDALPSIFRRNVTASARQKAFGNAAASYIRAIGAESATEALQEVVGMLGEQEAQRRYRGEVESTIDWARAGQAFTHTLQGMVVLGGLGAGGRLAVDLQRAGNAAHTERVLNELGKIEDSSKLGSRDADVRARFVSEVAEDANAGTVFVRGDAFAQTLRDTTAAEAREGQAVAIEELERRIPGITAKVEEAERTGGDVALDAGDFQAKLGPELRESLKDHATFGDGMTPAEAREFNRQDETAKAVEEIRAQQEVEQQFRDSAREVEDSVYQQLQQSGVVSARDSRAQAQLFRDFVATQAADMGILPSEFMAQFPLSVVSGGPSGRPALRSGKRAEFDPSRLTVTLFENANASTFLHESAHYFLHVYGELAGSGQATSRQQADFGALLSSFGVASPEAWREMSIEQQREHHEAFALNFERYMLEGGAPSAELAGLFQRFAAWLRRIYRSISGELNDIYQAEFDKPLPILTGEVRQIMDRMLASEEQIAQTEAVRGLVMLYQDQAESGMSDEEWAGYLEQHAEQRAAAADKLTRDSLRQMKWLSKSRSRVLKEVQARAAEARAGVRAEVEQEVDTLRVNRVRHWLRTGRVRRADGGFAQGEPDADHRLRSEDVLAIARGRDNARIRSFMSKEGVAPDRVAKMFGYDSGAALVDDLLSAPTRVDAIEARTDARMLEEHGDLVGPEAQELAVHLALHNEARIRFVASELRAAAKASQPTRQMVAAAKEAAKNILATKTVAELRPRDFSIAAGRASREAAKALASGDIESVVEWKRRELLQHQLAKQAAEARQEIDKAKNQFGRLFKSDERIAKTRDTAMVRAGRAILTVYGLGSADKSPLTHLEPVKKYNPVAYAALLPEVSRLSAEAEALPGNLKYRAMTLSQFRELRELVDMLWHDARRSRQVELDGRRQSREAVAARILEAMDKHLDGVRELSTPDGPVDTARNWLTSYAANGTRVERLMLNLDGGTPGVFTDLWNRVKEAGNAHRANERQLIERYEGMLKAHDWGPRVQIDASRELGKIFDSKAELLGVLRHTGNESNAKKALVSEGWAEIRDDGLLDTRRWDRYVQQLVDDGVLTEADFDLVQSIWDMHEELLPELQRVHRENFGYTFREVPAKAFNVTFPDGKTKSYRGGYVPAKADRKGNRSAQAFDVTSVAEFNDAFAVVPRGMTKDRNENYTRKLSYDLADAANDLAASSRFVHMTGAVRDVQSVLKVPEVERALLQKNGAIYEQILDPWLKRSALQQVSEEDRNPARNMVARIAQNTNMTLMATNVGVALQNFTGFINALLHVKPKHMLAAAGAYLSNPRGTTQRVRELSTEMRNRQGRQMFEIRNHVKKVTVGTSGLRRGVDWVREHAYDALQVTQNVVDTIVWLGAYNQSKAAGALEVDAVRDADRAVRQTQMATDPEDVSAWESSQPFFRALFPFQAWFINWANTTAGNWKYSEQAGGKIAVAMYGYLLPLIVAQLVSDAVNGRIADEDDDGYGDDLLSLSVRSVVGGSLSALPLFGRPLQAAANRWLDDEVWNDRMPSAPFVSTFERALRSLDDATQGEAEVRDLSDIATFFGNLAGVPIGAITQRFAVAYRAEAGITEPESGYDYLRSLVTGRESRLAR